MDNYSSTGLRPEDWERIVDILPDGIYVTNARGLTIKVNAAYEHMTGLSARQLVGRYIADIVKEGILSNSITQRVIDKGGEVTAEQTTAKGKRLALHGIPIYKSGSIILVVTIVKDITVINELGKELDHSRQIVNQYKSRLNELEGSPRFVAESPQFQAAVALAHKVAKVDSTVLILGESGTGKEVLAREIYQKSYRRDQPFLKINCGAIPDNLLESELFGYDSGAFTGAKKGGHMGLFESASKGILFLDEIGDMPLHLQVKLLRVLQEHTVTRLGSTKVIPINTRVIAATNQDLEQMVREKTFREDLYYRLNIVVIKSPPLRERKADIPSLIKFFAKKLNAKYHLNKQLSPELISALMDYNWPGNVRELENIVERVLVTSSSDLVSVEEARLPWQTAGPAGALDVAAPFEEISLKEACERLEKRMLLDAARRYKTTYQIAEALQISQPSVSRKLKKYRCELPQ